MPVLTHISQLAVCPAPGGQAEIQAIADAALVWREGTIEWVGPKSALSPQHRQLDRLDAGGRLVVPGLVDCHTHLAFGGWRSTEFEQRIQGKSYLEILGAGGGILNSVRATRLASEDDLTQRALFFLERMAGLGVTTVECKSGYGLDTETELKQLRAYRRLSDLQPLRIVSTFLGAHVTAPEFRDAPQRYLDLIIEEMIPAVAEEKLARFCDVFVEESAFGPNEARRIFEAAARHGLRAKVHADQLSDGGGAGLAAEVGAVSADHLECASQDGIRLMAESGVVAVDLPLASLYLNQAPMNARRAIEAGTPLAIATDFNPGSAPSYHLPLAMMLACNQQRLTPAEALKGATIYAARAIGMEDLVGSLEAGKAADFAIVDAPDVNHWMYHFQPEACVATYVDGKSAFHRATAPSRWGQQTQPVEGTKRSP